MENVTYIVRHGLDKVQNSYYWSDSIWIVKFRTVFQHIVYLLIFFYRDMLLYNTWTSNWLTVDDFFQNLRVNMQKQFSPLQHLCNIVIGVFG